jgi:hypothetical protein
LNPGVPSYTPTPLVSEKVVRTLLVVWNFGAPNATPALPSSLPVCAPRGRATPRAQAWGPVAIGHVFPRFEFWVHKRCTICRAPYVHFGHFLSKIQQKTQKRRQKCTQGARLHTPWSMVHGPWFTLHYKCTEGVGRDMHLVYTFLTFLRLNYIGEGASFI